MHLSLGQGGGREDENSSDSPEAGWAYLPEPNGQIQSNSPVPGMGQLGEGPEGGVQS